MSTLPTGTVTFLFSDIEGSTRLWREDTERMDHALRRHDAILREAIQQNSGHVFNTAGDAFCAVFATALDAVSAAQDAQKALHREPWSTPRPLRVRMAIHTGEAIERDGDFFGPAVNRTARILSIGHGGQTLVSLVAAELARDLMPDGLNLKDMGAQRLKDLTRREIVYQLTCEGLPSEFPPLASLDSSPHNLPTQPTPLIGREKELAEITRLLFDDHARIVTLVGPGGMGKTRLAIQAAAETVDRFADGAFLVDLAPVKNVEQVLPAIAKALNIRERGTDDLMDTIRSSLADRSMLVVLDNYEQIIEAASVTAELAGSCPGVCFLVTSREALRIRGETTLPIPPLELPREENRSLPPAEKLSGYESVRLFVERAVAVKSDFQVDNENAPAVAEICIHLDGIPLAIELAAARIRLLSPSAILQRLEDRFRLLTRGARDLPDRQKTLRAAIDWSYNLLDGTAQQLFGMLSVFTGGFTIEAAQEVCQIDELDLLDGVDSLLEKSFLARETNELGDERFVMLETLREYGRDRLEESGQAAPYWKRHAAYYLSLAEVSVARLHTSEVRSTLDRLETEQGNFNRAARWFEHESEAEKLLRLWAALSFFWVLRGYFAEGRERLEKALAHCSGASAVACFKALLGLGRLLGRQGDYETALARMQRAVQMARSHGMGVEESSLHYEIGSTLNRMGKNQEAAECFQRALELAREFDSRECEAMALLGTGMIARRLGQWGNAKEALEQARAMAAETGNLRTQALAHGNLGLVARQTGSVEEALEHQEQALAIKLTIGDWDSLRLSYNNLGDLSLRMGLLDKSRDYYNKLQRLAAASADQRRENWAWAGIAETELACSRPEQALAAAERAFDIAEGLGESVELGLACRVLGESLLALGRTERARQLLVQGLALLEKYHVPDEVQKARKTIEAHGWSID
jgi:predicted ATPase/class 3 adenylate cyclase